MNHRARHLRARRRLVAQLRGRPVPPVMVTVYLSTDPHSLIHGYRPGETFLLADRFLLDHAVRATADDDPAILERVFDALNDHPGPGDVHHTRRWYRRGLRSLSVGDVVTLGTDHARDIRHYACAAIGWLRVPQPG